MNRLTTVAITLAATVALGSTLANASGYCTPTTQAQWKSVDDVTVAAKALGYQVKLVKTQDGCYEVYGFDKNGSRVEVYFDPASLKVVRVNDKS